MIKYNQIGSVASYFRRDFLYFTAADEMLCIRRTPMPAYHRHRYSTGRRRQFLEFFEQPNLGVVVELKVNQNGARTELRALK